MLIKAISVVHDHQRELIQKRCLAGSLNRAEQTIAWIGTADVASWRLT